MGKADSSNNEKNILWKKINDIALKYLQKYEQEKKIKNIKKID